MVPFRQGAGRGQPGREARGGRSQRPASPREIEVEGFQEGSSRDWHPSAHKELAKLTQPQARVTPRKTHLKKKKIMFVI